MKVFSSSLILSVVALLFLKYLSTCTLEFPDDPLFLFVLFNTIIISVIAASHKQLINEFDGAFSYLCSSSEVEASFDDTEQCSNTVDVSVCEDDTGNSDGYYEDDDDDDDDDMDESWYGEEEYGDDLQQRIEDFIAKVNNGWREEWLNEKDYEQLYLQAYLHDK